MMDLAQRGPTSTTKPTAHGAFNPTSVLGAWLIGTLGATFFLGIAVVQSAAYFAAFPRDNAWVKRLVWIVILLSFLQVGCVIAAAWEWFIADWGLWGTGVRIPIPWTVESEPVIAQLTTFFAQLFFVYRCFILTKRSWVVVVLLVASMLAALGLWTAVTVALSLDPYNTGYSKRLSLCALSITIFTDLVITGLTTWKLLASKSGFIASTDSGISKLLRVTWEAAVPPAILAVANIVVYLTLSSKNILYTVFNIMMPRLYVFSLLFSLNSRPAIRSVFESSTQATDSDPSSWTSSSPWAIHKRNKRNNRGSTQIVFAPTDFANDQGATRMTTMSLGQTQGPNQNERGQVEEEDGWGTSDEGTAKTLDEESR